MRAREKDESDREREIERDESEREGKIVKSRIATQEAYTLHGAQPKKN